MCGLRSKGLDHSKSEHVVVNVPTGAILLQNESFRETQRIWRLVHLGVEKKFSSRISVRR
jgi:hypothetical protein